MEVPHRAQPLSHDSVPAPVYMSVVRHGLWWSSARLGVRVLGFSTKLQWKLGSAAHEHCRSWDTPQALLAGNAAGRQEPPLSYQRACWCRCGPTRGRAATRGPTATLHRSRSHALSGSPSCRGPATCGHHSCQGLEGLEANILSIPLLFPCLLSYTPCLAAVVPVHAQVPYVCCRQEPSQSRQCTCGT